MSADEQIPTAVATATDPIVEQERSDKILKAKELYSHGSRNFLVKSYAEAADELSQVCALYEELYGELSDELGMPYLLYAKSLIALALDENKVVDVPDQEEDGDVDDDDAEDDEEDGAEAEANGTVKATMPANGSDAKLETIKEVTDDTVDKKKIDEADSTADTTVDAVKPDEAASKTVEESAVSSTAEETESAQNGNAVVGEDDDKPSTSNGKSDAVDGAADMEDDDEENEAASSLQLAWEILELAAKIFSRQGLSGLPNLAEVKTELANIEFENNILDAAREDYENALKIYDELPNNYRRARAEIRYKIGLTYLMQQANKEGADALKQACSLIEQEIEEIKAKSEQTDKDKNTIQDLEETKQEIWVKISEIEETQAQTIAEVRAALDSYIKPFSATDAATSSSSASTASATAAASSSSAAVSSSSKPTDISHLIKRKKPEEGNSEAEAASPAKRPAV